MVVKLVAWSDSADCTIAWLTKGAVTGMLFMHVILSAGILFIIVGVLALAIEADHRRQGLRTSRVGSPDRSAAAPQRLVSLALAE